MNKNLYVITPIFNPFGFRSRIRLYKNFAKHMEESGAKLFTVEIAFGHKDFEVTTAGNPMNLQLRTNQILWHKERAINLARKHLLETVPDAKFFGWIDADVTFANPNWVEESVHQLSHLAVIQPYGQAINLDSNDEEQWHVPSAYRHFIETRGYHQFPPMPTAYTYKGHPGLAWCATREALDGIGGLYERCVAGSGDTIVSNALKGDWNVYLPGKPTEAMLNSIRTWSERAAKVVKGRIGYVHGALLHHWHGEPGQRGYEKRWDIMSFHQFDPAADVMVDPTNGLFRWAGNKPQLEDDIRFSLHGRDEDAPTV